MLKLQLSSESELNVIVGNCKFPAFLTRLQEPPTRRTNLRIPVETVSPPTKTADMPHKNLLYIIPLRCKTILLHFQSHALAVFYDCGIYQIGSPLFRC